MKFEDVRKIIITMPTRTILLLHQLQDDFDKCVAALRKIDNARVVARTVAYVKTLVKTFSLEHKISDDESVFGIKRTIEKEVYWDQPVRIATIMKNQNKIMFDMLRCHICPCYVVCQCNDKIWQCGCMDDECACERMLCRCTYNLIETFHSTQTCGCVGRLFDVEL